MLFIEKHKIIIFLIAIGTFLRFYNLNWGAPFYFHPDERNIASSVSQLRFPEQMNPHFFAYGSFPIYVIYFSGLLLNSIFPFFSTPNPQLPTPNSVSFEQTILVSRTISALLSTLLIPTLYFIGIKIKNKIVGLLAAVLGTFSVGLIQFAHFGTFEMWITFLAILLFYVCLEIIEKYSIKKILIAGIICGLLIATKVSSLVLISIPALTLLLTFKFKNIPYSNLAITKLLKDFIFLFVAFSITFLITSPFVLFDFSSFLSSINYESSVAFGTLPVFYTGEFFNTTPVIFQFLRIYPFILNPLLTILFIPSFIYLVYNSLRKKDLRFYILNTLFLILLLPNVFLFVKWTRYIIPTLPFMYLIISIFIVDVFNKSKIKRYYQYAVIFIVLCVSIIFTFSYFITSFIKPDTRTTAAIWARNNLLSNANILSEVYDLGIVPFNPYLQSIKLFNFYDLDSNSETLEDLNQILANTNYIIIPSQRIMKTRLINNQTFPTGYGFYKSLFEEKIDFKKIYETPCDIFCRITYLNSPVFSFEETANVFDRPTIFIFERR